MTKNIFSLFILSLTLISISTVSAKEDCKESQLTPPPTTITKLATSSAAITNKVSDNVTVKAEAAATYLMAIDKSTSFNEKEANNFIASLTPSCDNSEIEVQLRSKICTELSELHGKLADKLQMSGIENSKNFYKYLNLAISLNPNNPEAVLDHAEAIVDISKLQYFIRKIAESKLNIDTTAEAKKAKANLERLRLTGNPIYKEVVDILQ